MSALPERAAPGRWTPVEPCERPVLVINPWSGGGRAGRARLADAARARGVRTRVLEKGDDLGALIEEAVSDGAGALGMAGGDGSLAVVAAAASAHDLPFVCVPAGTRNHFARDLGVPPDDLVGALDAFTDPLERRIDTGEVNGRHFLNNVSLGIYASAVQQAGYRSAKARTLFETAAAELGPSAELPAVRLRDERGHTHSDPAVLLVSNNPYALDRPPRPRGRPTLDGGTLGVIVLYGPGRRHVPGRAWTADSLVVEAARPLAAGVDGEALHLEPPLRFAIRPRTLRVRIARAHRPGRRMGIMQNA